MNTTEYVPVTVAEIDALTRQARENAVEERFWLAGDRLRREGAALIEAAALTVYETQWVGEIAATLLAANRPDDAEVWSAALRQLDTMPL